MVYNNIDYSFSLTAKESAIRAFCGLLKIQSDRQSFIKQKILSITNRAVPDIFTNIEGNSSQMQDFISVAHKRNSLSNHQMASTQLVSNLIINFIFLPSTF
ncbi:hypothetical protein HHI36_004688 [Cryptolaemus montrouzieri]|uniref:Uncharacterized protein n=1 Tax=Cryptolaemus montrouzieri TaxID=559131 RepID=A0ABD2NS99_9CUCU